MVATRHRDDHRVLRLQVHAVSASPSPVCFACIVWLLMRSAMLPDLRGLIKRAFEMTMRLTAMVVFILIGSTASRPCSRA
jgi:hypothetical protein